MAGSKPEVLLAKEEPFIRRVVVQCAREFKKTYLGMCIIHEKASQQVPSDHVDSTSRTELLHRSSFLAIVTMTRLGK